MNWQHLTSDGDWEAILKASETHPQVVYKHSTRCSISTVAKTRLERATQPENVSFHYLDLIRYRTVSNRIAEDTGVRHESPQVLLIVDGKAVYNESHMAINMRDIAAAI
ncbi:MAG: bacillithiol system redox-active protein YtxJ [Chitinophagaceae bacterium]|nr:bacillithiol system redox-active protein YtxJ [Chitinophagaceae bacterium]MCW5925455.1 bacillithiol system redox-active protein YtxJ [Chitinophagaceae bacterium]